MADSGVEIGEHQVTSATAVELSRASSEAHKVVKSWADHNHRVDYAEEPLGRSRIRDSDYLLKYTDNGITENHCAQDDEKWSGQEELFSGKEIHTADRSNVNADTNDDKMDGDICNNRTIINDRKIILCKKDNDSFGKPKEKLGITCATPLNNETGRNNKIFSKCNHVNAIVVDDNEGETRAVHDVKIAIPSANKRINNSSESAYSFRNVDKRISSGKCKYARNIEDHKNDCNVDDAEPMEISASQSLARSHGNDIVVFNASRIGELREGLQDETTCKVIRSFGKDNRAGKMRRFASARSALRDQKESRDQETDITVPRIERKERDAAGKCENCGESHFSYNRYSQLWRYSGYLNRSAAVAVYEAANRNAVKIAGNKKNRETNSTRMAPIATAVLYRSKSLPRLSVHNSEVACSDHTPAAPKQATSRQLVADLKQLLTLKQHYYPEGGWGWVILLVGLLVQILSHGAHGAVGVFLQQVAVKFGPHEYLQAG